MIPSPILKVLSSIRAHQVQALLMGGQACVFYGAAEFSRDTDLVLLASAENLDRLKSALGNLQAEPIATPPLELDYLRRGHAVHFRCRRADVEGMRVDLMSQLRGVAPFEELWARRTTLTDADGSSYELLSLPDLVKAKKTQRDKDWPMLRRLVETDYFQYLNTAGKERIEFWCSEARTPEILIDLARAHRAVCEPLLERRDLFACALSGDVAAVREKLEAEEKRERELDREYWRPLRKELEQLRRQPKDTGPSGS